jgi:hypothetical protein
MARMRSAILGMTAGMREEAIVRASIAEDAHEWWTSRTRSGP